jgi:hypothetical protein
VPDIRVQCAELARHLLSRAPGESAGAARVRLGGGTA